ncbi:MAG: zinc ribbon domain-containing protein [Pseudomonadota bacterium]|nr:zinc ribbon domain-containing protein [Pseudomonadota bacterium]
MPIYAYRCSNCGHAQDALQKLSDPVLTVCPACGEPTYVKQVTAAGFQLKGAGWYVTDFRGDNRSGKTAAEGGDGDKSADKADGKGTEKAAESKSGEPASSGDAKSGESTKKAEGAPAATPAPAASPAPAAPAPAPSGKTGS